MDYRRANMLLRKAVALKPDRPEAYDILGIVLQATGCYAEAVQSFLHAAARHPQGSACRARLRSAVLRRACSRSAAHAAGAAPSRLPRRWRPSCHAVSILPLSWQEWQPQVMSCGVCMSCGRRPRRETPARAGALPLCPPPGSCALGLAPHSSRQSCVVSRLASGATPRPHDEDKAPPRTPHNACHSAQFLGARASSRDAHKSFINIHLPHLLWSRFLDVRC